MSDRATLPSPAAARSYAVLAPLDGSAPVEPGRLPRVCIVTAELVGPFKNGGLGTAMTGLAELLGAHGADVTLLYTGRTEHGTLRRWRARYREVSITLETIGDFAAAPQLGPIARVGWTNAWLVYEVLRQRRFDVIHFNDTCGEGAFCLIAKRLGLAFEGTLLSLALHSPTEWILEANGHAPDWLGFTCFEAAERMSIAAADLLWGPSRYLLDWLVERGYRLPTQVYNQQYVIPTTLIPGGARAAAVPPAAAARRPAEIVFFGRLEKRKGLRLFTAAVTRIGDELARRGVGVVFMGKPNAIDGVPADRWLAKRAAGWRFAWRIESGFGQPEAIAYLTGNLCLAVMASPVDNSPCTVYEALQFGLPFLAAATGGTPELVHPDDHARHLFDYRIEALAARLLDALDNGIGVARPAIAAAENAARWLAMHLEWRRFLPPRREVARPRRYAVVIDHAGGANELEKSWAAIRRELGDSVAVSVVLQRELAPLGTLAGKSAPRVIDDLSDETPGELFAGFREAGADAVLAIRSGVGLAQGCAPIFDRALMAEAEGLLPFADVAGKFVLPRLGGAALGFLEGEFDAGGALFDLAAVDRRLGDGLAGLDCSRRYLGLLEEMEGRGATLWPIPAPLFRLAHPRAAIVALRDEAARCRAYAAASPGDLRLVLGIARFGYRVAFPVRPFALGWLRPWGAAAIGVARRTPGALEAARRITHAVAGERGIAALRTFVRRMGG